VVGGSEVWLHRRREIVTWPHELRLRLESDLTAKPEGADSDTYGEARPWREVGTVPPDEEPP